MESVNLMRKYLFKHFVELTGNPVLSSALRSFSKSRLSQPIVRPFVKTFGIKTDEMEYPISSYKNLHALFTRRLTDHIRPIDESKTTLVSPVDAIAKDMGKISAEQTFYIKDRLYRLDDILGDAKRAADYQSGYYYVFYLSPRHYHRIHYPIKGTLISRYALGEKSFPVNDLGIRYGDHLFSTNYRIMSEIATNFGKLNFIKVGALNINSIDLINTATDFEKGDELGYFSFGSTVILLLEHHPQFIPTIELNAEVEVGQTIGKWE